MRTQDKLRAIELRAIGLTYNKIAEFTGVSHATVKKFFNDPKACAEAEAFGEQLRAAKLLRGLGVPFTEIAQRLNMPFGQVLDCCESVPVVGRYVPPAAPPVEPNDAKAQRLRKAGYTHEQIAAHMGMSLFRLRKLLKGAQPEPLPPLPPRGKLPQL